ncbi:MAG: hypothetical protein QXN55_00355 [Candidatus Nitrosotenuis sp.]
MVDKLKLLILLICSFCTAASAKTFEFSNGSILDVSGYLGWSQIWLSSGTHAYNWNEKERGDISSGPEIGALVSYHINDKITLFSQVKTGSSLNDILVYSFADFHFYDDEDWSFSVQGGRLRHDIGLYNQTRVNPRTRLGIIPPQAIYWHSLRELLTSGTGISARVKYKNLSISYSVVDPSITNSKVEAYTWSAGIFDKFDTHFGSQQILAVEYHIIPELRAKFNWLSFNAGNSMSDLGKTFFNVRKEVDQFMLGGIEYKKGPFMISGEAIWFKTFDQTWTKGSNLSGPNSKGFSLTTSYDITDNLTACLNYNEYDAGYVPPKSPWLHYAKDINAGITYHEDNWQVSVEGHHINGGRWVSPNEKARDPNAFRNWWIVGVQAVYFFD